MTCGSFFEYLANIFKPYIDQQNIPTPVILFFDGHSSHLSLQLSKFCRKNGIILVTLPPNATHILQPLDVTVFGPLKNNWKRVLERYKLSKKVEPRKCHVLPILDEIFKESNFKENLKKGFETCGLRPLNPDNVDYTKCLSKDDKDNSTAESSSETNSSDTSALLLQQFEDKVPGCLLNDFKKVGPTGHWSGNEKFCGLFNFYKAIKFNLNFEDLMNEELSNHNIQDISPVQIDNEGTYLSYN